MEQGFSNMEATGDLDSSLGGAVGGEDLMGVDSRENWRRGGRDSERLLKAI